MVFARGPVRVIYLSRRIIRKTHTSHYGLLHPLHVCIYTIRSAYESYSRRRAFRFVCAGAGDGDTRPVARRDRRWNSTKEPFVLRILVFQCRKLLYGRRTLPIFPNFHHRVTRTGSRAREKCRNRRVLEGENRGPAERRCCEKLLFRARQGTCSDEGTSSQLGAVLL